MCVGVFTRKARTTAAAGAQRRTTHGVIDFGVLLMFLLHLLELLLGLGTLALRHRLQLLAPQRLLLQLVRLELLASLRVHLLQVARRLHQQQQQRDDDDVITHNAVTSASAR